MTSQLLGKWYQLPALPDVSLQNKGEKDVLFLDFTLNFLPNNYAFQANTQLLTELQVQGVTVIQQYFLMEVVLPKLIIGADVFLILLPLSPTVWSLKSGKCFRTLMHSSPVLTVRMDGTHVVSGGHRGLVKVWSAETGALIKVSFLLCV